MELPLLPADWLGVEGAAAREASRTPGVGVVLLVVVSPEVVLELVFAEQELPPVPAQLPEEFGDVAVEVVPEDVAVPDGATRGVPPVVWAKATGPDRAIATAAAK